MPKLVDHAERRDRIIRAAWRLIADRGFDAATMREIAREAGFANGALTHYFADKDALLRASYEYVYAATEARIAEAVRDAAGVPALRAFGREILPLDELTVVEARLIVAVWPRLLLDPTLAEIHTASMSRWREEISGWLAEGRAREEVHVPTADGVLADQLLTLLMGAQVVVLSGGVAGPAAQEAAFEDWLTRLAQR